MEVRAKKALGQHFLTDLKVAQDIADALAVPSDEVTDVLEVGPGMGVLTRYLLKRQEIALKMVEIDRESVDYLLVNFPQVNGSLIEADFLKMGLGNFFRHVLRHRELPVQHFLTDFLQDTRVQGTGTAGGLHDTEGSGGAYRGKAGNQDLRNTVRTAAGMV